MTPVTRRQFLGALLGLGASLALHGPLDVAAQADIDRAWDALVAQPFAFEVSEFGTITEPCAAEPKIRRDVYDIDTAYIRSIADLIREIDQHAELSAYFQGLVPEPYSESDDGWREWLTKEESSALPGLLAEVDEWLDDDVDWQYMEFWPDGWSGQCKALNFFQQLGRATLEDIGVVIVEGEHPGSTYYAAELRADIEEANSATARLGLPFKFKAEGA